MYTVPPPTDVSITSDPISPIWPIESDVTLTCIVKLDSAVDVPVTVKTVWTGPNGFTNTSQASMMNATIYSSIAMVSSFGRDQSGVYRCAATVNSTLLSGEGSTKSVQERITVGKIHMHTDVSVMYEQVYMSVMLILTGVYLSLKEKVYANNSIVSITDIGTDQDAAFQCITDRMPCCSYYYGEWYFPNESVVYHHNHNMIFYRATGNNGRVSLIRASPDVMSPTGQFCCVVPDAAGINKSACINVCKYRIIDKLDF